MGPDTYPGRLRGLYGGSLWLEPTFDGLQWPQFPHGHRHFGHRLGRQRLRNHQARSAHLANSTSNLQQGRALLRVTPAYVRERFFIQGQAELVANACQAGPNAQTTACARGTVTTDDLWIRVGHWDPWDLTFGRFEGWEVYHLGMGLDPYTLERLGAGMFGQHRHRRARMEAPSLYGVNYMHDRPAEGLAVGHAALHVYPTDFLRFELLGKWGSDNYQDNNATAAKPYNYVGGRPVAILDVGWFKFKVGAEYQKGTAVMQTIGGPGKPQPRRIRWKSRPGKASAPPCSSSSIPSSNSA